MNLTIHDKCQPLPSILTVYRPIEEYWESSDRPAAWVPSRRRQSIRWTRFWFIACSISPPAAHC